MHSQICLDERENNWYDNNEKLPDQLQSLEKAGMEVYGGIKNATKESFGSTPTFAGDQHSILL